MHRRLQETAKWVDFLTEEYSSAIKQDFQTTNNTVIFLNGKQRWSRCKNRVNIFKLKWAKWIWDGAKKQSREVGWSRLACWWLVCFPQRVSPPRPACVFRQRTSQLSACSVLNSGPGPLHLFCEGCVVNIPGSVASTPLCPPGKEAAGRTSERMSLAVQP